MGNRAKYSPMPSHVIHDDGSITTYSKRCSRAGCRTKPLGDFPASNRNRDGRASQCLECMKSDSKRHYVENPDYFQKRWQARVREGVCRRCDRPSVTEAHCEVHIEYVREANAASRKRLRARTDDEMLADRTRLRPDGLKRCRAGHIASVSEFATDRSRSDGLRDVCRQHANQALVKSVIDRWEELDLWRCVYCDAEFEHVDHMIPQAHGGFDHFENLLPACAACNLSKHDRTPAEWLPTIHAEILSTVWTINAHRKD